MKIVYSNIRHARNPYYAIFILTLVSCALCSCMILDYGLQDYMYIIIFAINCNIAIWNILDLNHQPYSLKLLVNFYILIFFILANAVQYSNYTGKDNILSFYIHFTREDFVIFQFVVLFILVIFNFFYKYVRVERTKLKKIIYSINSKRLLTISLFATIIILVYYKFSLFQLFFRGVAEEYMSNMIRYGDDDSSMQLIFKQFVRPIPWACYLVAEITELKSKSLKTVLLIFAVITLFPTGVARNQAAMCWIPIILLSCKKWIKGRRFVYILLVGILLVFPILDIFRYWKGESNFKYHLILSMQYLNTMNFDASQIFMVTLKTDFITYGYQLLGVFLFFVPRSLWISKPIGSGHILAMIHHGELENISMPYFAEGYVNFGLIGIICFTVFLSYIAKKLDTSFWLNYDTPIQKGIYIILCGAIIFILRGDLMSSFAYTVAACLSYIFVFSFAKEKNKSSVDKI